MEISKSAVLLANEHQSDQKKNVTNNFRIIFSLYIRSRKDDAVNGMPEMYHQGGF